MYFAMIPRISRNAMNSTMKVALGTKKLLSASDVLLP